MALKFRHPLLSLLIALPFVFLADAKTRQASEKPATQNPVGGVSTGAAHAPVKDALSRPITAGGFVDGAPVIFVDATRAAGLDKFRHRAGTPEKKTILETPDSGVALLDYDNDGWLDIYLVTVTFTSARSTSIWTD